MLKFRCVAFYLSQLAILGVFLFCWGIAFVTGFILLLIPQRVAKATGLSPLMAMIVFAPNDILRGRNVRIPRFAVGNVQVERN